MRGWGILLRLLPCFYRNQLFYVGRGLAPAVFNWTGFTPHPPLRDTFCSAANGNPSVCFADISPNRGVSSRRRLPSGNLFAERRGRRSLRRCGRLKSLSIYNSALCTLHFALKRNPSTIFDGPPPFRQGRLTPSGFFFWRATT